MKQVVILGGGFAGVQTAIELQKKGGFQVTLVSDRDYLYLYPISIWIPVHIREFDEVRLPLSRIQQKYPFRVVIDTVKAVQATEQHVECQQQSLHYDYLVIAVGAEKLQPKGVEHTLSICGKPEVSQEIRTRLDELIEKGHGRIAVGFGGNPKDKSAVRGGPAFELMFNIHHYLKKNKLRNQFELTFFAPMSEPGARMGRGALAMMDKMFRKYRIAQRFGKKIDSFTCEGVTFEDQTKLPSDLTLFIPAGTGPKWLQNSGLPLSESGFIRIDDTGLVQGFDNVYAVGDVAALEGPDWIAKQGHIAELMGRNAAFNINKHSQGKDERKGYGAHLNILCVMDTGTGAAFVLRDGKKALMIPLPIVGHWLKKGWGHYAQLTKTGKFPRLPGM